jgi:hypothetical protein
MNLAMAKPPKKPKPEEIETKPDEWDRFKRTIARMVPARRKAKLSKARKERPKKGGSRRPSSKPTSAT